MAQEKPTRGRGGRAESLFVSADTYMTGYVNKVVVCSSSTGKIAKLVSESLLL